MSSVQQIAPQSALLNKAPSTFNYVLFTKKKSKTLRIASINMNSRYFDQIPKIYDIIREQKIDILCIQDIGVKSKRKRSDFYTLRNFETIIQHPEQNSKEGLAIIYNKSISCKEPVGTIHKEARMIQLKLEIANTEYIINNVYIVPQKNASRTAQLTEIEKVIEKGMNNILIGDINSYESDSLDRWSNISKKSKIGGQKIFEMFRKLELQDSYRLINGK